MTIFDQRFNASKPSFAKFLKWQNLLGIWQPWQRPAPRRVPWRLLRHGPPNTTPEAERRNEC